MKLVSSSFKNRLTNVFKIREKELSSDQKLFVDEGAYVDDSSDNSK